MIQEQAWNNSWFGMNYTLLQNTAIFLKNETDPNRLYIIGKGIYRRVRFILDIDKIFWFRDSMSDFREIVKFKQFLKFEKFQTLRT